MSKSITDLLPAVAVSMGAHSLVTGPGSVDICRCEGERHAQTARDIARALNEAFGPKVDLGEAERLVPCHPTTLTGIDRTRHPLTPDPQALANYNPLDAAIGLMRDRPLLLMPDDDDRAFEPGAVVRLKSGSPSMTVTGVHRNLIDVVWFTSDGFVGKESFRSDSLRPAPNVDQKGQSGL
jgi:uncharacterized protein YodC (DUF2158 family)